MCFIEVPFDPKEVFGKVRAPVRVTLNGYTYRSTISAMGGVVAIPLRKSNRQAAGVVGGETIEVRLELDEEARTVDPPEDLLRALKSSPAAWEKWQSLSFTHRREYVDAVTGAKKPETRARRIEKTVEALSAPAKP